MSKIFFDAAISLDGFIAGENRGPKNPLGDHGLDIHKWMFVQKAFWEHHGGNGGEVSGDDGKLIHDVFARAGAGIMGKRMFEEGEPNWPEDLFKGPVYVLTHEKREPWVQKGSSTFYFTDNDIKTVLEKAKRDAKEKDVRIHGGANNIQQFLNAGLIDECTIHITPILLGSGIRLFENIDTNKFDIRISSIHPSDLTTHINYQFIKK